MTICATKMNAVLSIALLALFLPSPLDAYASWLKCYVPLEKDEIVMHNEIVAAEDAEHTVNIEVSTSKDDDAQWFQPKDFTYSEKGETVFVRLAIPAALEYAPFQYVIETTDGGEFTENAMCNGTRAFAREADEVLSLKLSGNKESVHVWAGWASAFEAVKLTENITLKRKAAVVEEEL